jgi:hypothetical protein
MSLKNLLGISLDAIEPDRTLIARLMSAARRNIGDASLAALSAENRFDAAYKAIMQTAMIALNANGYRTLTSKPGHHQTALQTLPLSVGLPQPRVLLLDALRKQRNLSDYSGDPIPDTLAQECLETAQDLLAHVQVWLEQNRPDLL